MVQFKSGVVSYKNHKNIEKPQESWIRCEHTHDALIDMETWTAVQEKFQKSTPKQRRKKDGEQPLFSGLLWCADCGSGLRFNSASYVGKDGTRSGNNSYCCRKFRTGGKNACQSHWTGEQDLLELIETELSGFIRELQADERALWGRLIAERNQTATAEKKALESRQGHLWARLAQLDTLLKKLYEEMLLGQLSREMLLEMSERYTAEKNQKQAELEEISTKLTEYQNTVEDVDKWITVLKEYLSGRELDWVLLHKLIKEIKVGHYTKINGVKHQEITITYNF